MTHSNQILDRKNRAHVRSTVGENLENILDLVDDRLSYPMEVSIDGYTITIGNGLLQSEESDSLDGKSDSYRVGVPPLAGLETKPVVSTLVLNTGAYTGDFEAPVGPTLTANQYIRMGIELRPDGKYYAVFGAPSATLGGCGYPPFAIGSSIQLMVIDLRVGIAGGTWDFVLPQKKDIIVFNNASAGGGGTPNAKLLGGGVWAASNVSGDTSLEWSDVAYISLPGLQKERNRIQPSNVTLAEDEAAFVILNKLAGLDADLVVQKDLIINIFQYNPDLYLIARGFAGGVLVGNSCFSLIHGESKELDAGLSIENRALLGSGVTESTSQPEYALRGAPERTLDDTQGILEALSSMDVEIDKFFGQLRITPHETDTNKIRITGVDFTMKDGSVLSQEIASLLLKFDGAVVNLTTGGVFASNGTTPLGVDFVPATIPASQFNWYSIGLVANTLTANGAMTAQLIVLSGGPNASASAATIPSFAGSKKVGLVQVQNSGGSIVVSTIRQLGAGTGSGGGISNAKLISGGKFYWTGELESVYANSVTPNSVNTNNMFANWNAWQTFTAAGSGITKITSTAFSRSNSGVTGVLRGYIYAVNQTTGLPTATVVATSSNTVAIESLETQSSVKEYTPITFNFSSEALTPGLKYCALVKVVSISGGWIAPYVNNTNPLANEKCGIRYADLSEISGIDMNMSTGQLGSGTLSWDEAAYISMPGLDFARNTIPVGSGTLGANEALYVKVSTLDGAPANLTVERANITDISPYDSSIFIIAVKTTEGVVVGDTLLAAKQSRRLDDNRMFSFNSVSPTTLTSNITSRYAGSYYFPVGGRIKSGVVIYGDVISNSHMAIETNVTIYGNLKINGNLEIDATSASANETIRVYGDVISGWTYFTAGLASRQHTLTIDGYFHSSSLYLDTLNALSDMLNLDIKGDLITGDFSAYTKTNNTGFTATILVKGNFISSASVSIKHLETTTAYGYRTTVYGNLVVTGSLTYGFYDSVTGNAASNDRGHLEIKGITKVCGHAYFNTKSPHVFYGDADFKNNLVVYGAVNNVTETVISFMGNVTVGGEVQLAAPVGTSIVGQYVIEANAEFRAKALKKVLTNTYVTLKGKGKADYVIPKIYADSVPTDKAVWFLLSDSNSVMSLETYKSTNLDTKLVNYGSTILKTLLDGTALMRKYNWNNDQTYIVEYGKDTGAYDIIVDASGKGDYTTLRAATLAAGENDTIFIRNGVYNETGAINLKSGQTIIGESKDGVVLTTTETSWFLSALNRVASIYSTGPATNNVGFDSVSGIGTVSVTNGSRLVTYTGSTHPSNGVIAYILGDWYAVSSVDTINKTFNVDRDIFKKTQSGLAWRFGTPQGGVDYSVNQNQYLRIKNLTYKATTTASFLYANACVNIDVDNVDVISTAWNASNNAIIYGQQITNVNARNIRFYNKNTTAGADEPNVLYVYAAWDCSFEDWEIYGAKYLRMEGAVGSAMNYHCRVKFNRFNSDGLVWFSLNFCQECDFSHGVINCNQYNQSDYNFHKCRIDFFETRLFAGSSTIRGHDNIVNFGNMYLDNASFYVNKAQASGYLSKNILVSGNVIGAGTLYLDDSVYLGDSVYVQTLGGTTPARTPPPRTRTIVLDAAGGGDATTLASAISKAGNYGSIYIRNGVYTMASGVSMSIGQTLLGESKNGVILEFTSGYISMPYPVSHSMGTSFTNGDPRTPSTTYACGFLTLTTGSRTIAYSGDTAPSVGNILRVQGEWFEVMTVDSGAKTFTVDKDVRHAPFSSVWCKFYQKQYGVNISQNPSIRSSIKNLTVKMTSGYMAIAMGSCCDVEDVDIIDVAATGYGGMLQGPQGICDTNVRRVKVINANFNSGATTTYIRAIYLSGAQDCTFENIECHHTNQDMIGGEAFNNPVINCKFHFLRKVGAGPAFQPLGYMTECDLTVDYMEATNLQDVSGSCCLHNCRIKFGQSRFTSTVYMYSIGSTFDLGHMWNIGYAYVVTGSATKTPLNKVNSGKLYGSTSFEGLLNVDASVILTDNVQVNQLTGAPYSSPTKKMWTVVSADGMGDYTSISSACSSMPEGTTIFIRNGAYTEGLISVKAGQKFIGESKHGVRITGSTGVLFQPTAMYSGGWRSSLNSSNYEDFSSTENLGLASTTNGSTTVSYSGTGANPSANQYARICGEWYKVISVDTGLKTFVIDRTFTKGTYTGIPILLVSLYNGFYELHTYQSGGMEFKNMTILSGIQTNFQGFNITSQVGLVVDNIDVIGENASAGFTPFYLYACIGLRMTNCGQYAMGTTIVNSKSQINSGWENVIENHVVYGGYQTEIYGSAQSPAYRCKYHFRNITCIDAMFQFFRAMYECEIEVERGQAEKVTSQTGDAPSRCIFRFGKIRTTKGSIIKSIGCQFYIGNWIDSAGSTLSLGKGSNGVSFTPYNKLMSGNFGGALSVDGSVVITDGFHYTGTLTGTPAYKPVLSAAPKQYDYVVDPAGGGNYTTIQAAVAAAIEGRTIYVRNGNYDMLGVSASAANGLSIIGETMDGVRITSSADMFSVSGGGITMRARTPLIANMTTFDTTTNIGTVTVTNGSTAVVYTGDLTGIIGSITIGDAIALGTSELYSVAGISTGTKTITLGAAYIGASGSGLPCFITFGTPTNLTRSCFTLKNATLILTAGGNQCISANNAYKLHLENITCFHANTGGAGLVSIQSGFRNKLINVRTISTSAAGYSAFNCTGAWGLEFVNVECERSKYNYWGGGTTMPSLYCNLHFKRITESPALFFLGWGGQVFGSLVIDHVEGCRGGFMQDGGGTAEDLWHFYIEIKRMSNCAGQISLFGRNVTFAGGHLHHAGYFRLKSRQGSTNNVMMSGMFTSIPASNLEVDASTVICSAVVYPTGALSGAPKRNDGFAF